MAVVEAIRGWIEYRDLLYMLTWREVRVRYKQSIMGILWAVLMPLLIVGAGMLVRLAYANVTDTSVTIEDVAGVTVKALPWAFFVSAIRFGTMSLTGNSSLVTKIYFPRNIFPLSAVLAQLVDFTIAAGVVAIILPLLGVGISWTIMLVPLLLVVLFILTLGCSMVLSAGNLFFRDIKYLVEVFLTYGIFFTPVLYDVEMLGKWDWILLLNPIAPILEGVKSCIVQQTVPNLGWLVYSASLSFLCLVWALSVFKKVEPKFAECI